MAVRLDFDDLNNARRYRAMRVYGQSKLCNILFTYALAGRLAGTTVTATGTLGSYFSLRTLVVQASDVTPTGSASLPEPLGVSTGSANEALEGLRVMVSGLVTESPSTLVDGLGVTVDDGTGPIRASTSSSRPCSSNMTTCCGSTARTPA